MSISINNEMADSREALKGAGLPVAEISKWQIAEPILKGEFEADAKTSSNFFSISRKLLEKLPSKPKRNGLEALAADILLSSTRAVRENFLSKHVAEIYTRITNGYSRSVLAYDLPYEAALIVEGLTPTREQVAAEADLLQKDKEAIEIDQGIFFAHVLAHQASGLHFCHTMLLPGEESPEKLKYLQKHGSIDLGGAHVETKGDISWVTMQNPRFLNAEDYDTLGPIEEAVDLAILDPRTSAAVLRGSIIDHPKYNGRRVFCSGINLSHLYQGKFPFVWYLKRELGFMNKVCRGISLPGRPADDVFGTTIEKPWIGQVDSFAIGSGCQFLLPMDYIVAGDDAYFTLPASQEGILAGSFANFRLPRFVGDRMARQMIMMERRLECLSPEGKLICDEVVSPEQVERRIEDAVKFMINPGKVSLLGNRKAFRTALEPIDLYREYMSVFARQQAYCHFSVELIKNLEKQKMALKKDA